MTTITISDLRKAGVGTCQQARIYCRRNGISFDELRKKGIDAERVRYLTDQASDIARVIACAEEREKEEAENGR